MRIDLVTVVVEDYDRAIAFFVDILGFELTEDAPSLTNDGRPKRWVVVRPPGGGTGILLARADGERQAAAVGDQVAGRVGFFLWVDDFDAVHERMRAAGVEFVTSPRTEPYGRVVVFRDISGNRWDLLGPAPDERFGDIAPASIAVEVERSHWSDAGSKIPQTDVISPKRHRKAGDPPMADESTVPDPSSGPDGSASPEAAERLETALDHEVPYSARVWNHLLGGKDNFAADREAGERVSAVFPGMVDVARHSRHMLARVVRYLAGEAGIRQFLDIGTGLPAVDNTH